MAPRTVSLVSYRNSSAQHAHFAIFVPSSSDENRGTLIHVVGAPMAGYSLEFKRNYDIALTTQLYTIYPIGQIDSQHIVDSAAGTTSKGANHNGGAIEVAATQVAPPAISQNFLAPVNDTTNKWCQEWTVDYIRRLVQLGYIDQSAIQNVQAQRDPPSHRIGLKQVGAGQGRG